MRKSILFLASTFFMTITLLPGCQSSAEKVENAKDKVQEAQKDLEDSNNDLLQVRQDSINNYLQFKKEAEMKILAQDKNIADFKVRIAREKKEVKDTYEKKLVVLENKNSDLKKKLADFKDDGQNNWESFKTEFNHDMDELGNALKGLLVSENQ